MASIFSGPTATVRGAGDGIAAGLDTAFRRDTVRKELEAQEERLNIYRGNLALAEEAQAHEMELDAQQQDMLRAAQEYGALQSEVGDMRARAEMEGGMPTDPQEANLYARLSPDDQQFWRQDKIDRTRKMREDDQMASDYEGFQVVAESLPEDVAAQLAQQLEAAPTFEAFQETMKQVGQEYQKAVLLEQKAFVTSKIGEAIQESVTRADGADEYLMQVRSDLIQGKITPREAAAQTKAFSPDVASGLMQIVADRQIVRATQEAMSAKALAEVRGEAEAAGGLPPMTEAGEADAPVAPGERMIGSEPPPMSPEEEAFATVQAKLNSGEITLPQANEMMDALGIEAPKKGKGKKRKGPSARVGIYEVPLPDVGSARVGIHGTVGQIVDRALGGNGGMVEGEPDKDPSARVLELLKQQDVFSDIEMSPERVLELDKKHNPEVAVQKLRAAAEKDTGKPLDGFDKAASHVGFKNRAQFSKQLRAIAKLEGLSGSSVEEYIELLADQKSGVPREKRARELSPEEKGRM